MGQATVDLPDPLDAPPPSSLSGTDDLLAQLAGDEIDRLLAEADLEQQKLTATATPPPPKLATTSEPAAVAPAENAAPPAAPATAPAADPGMAVPGDDELDALLSKIEESAPPPPARKSATLPSAPANTAPTADGDAKSLVDRVPDILAQFPVPADAAKGAVGAAAGATGAAAAVAAPTPSDTTDVMSAAERDALKIAELGDEPDAATAGSEDGGRFAPLIKLLEALNAPLSFIPDALRDTLGKVAIVTLVNSIAVLVYVLFVRH